jgi:hypothetical protein
MEAGDWATSGAAFSRAMALLRPQGGQTLGGWVEGESSEVLNALSGWVLWLKMLTKVFRLRKYGTSGVNGFGATTIVYIFLFSLTDPASVSKLSFCAQYSAAVKLLALATSGPRTAREAALYRYAACEYM